MLDPIDRQAFLNLCEMSIYSMYELAALGELLEKNGLITKQEIYTSAKDLKQKTPPAEPRHAPIKATPSLPPSTYDAVIEQIMEVILRHGVTADHAKAVLERTIGPFRIGRKGCTQDDALGLFV